MDTRMPPLKIEILLESNPQESRILVRRLAVESVLAERLAAPVPECTGTLEYTTTYHTITL